MYLFLMLFVLAVRIEHVVHLEVSCPVNGYKTSSIWCPLDVFAGLPCLRWVFCRILQKHTSFCGRCRQNVRPAASADVSFQRMTPYLLLFLPCQYTTVRFVAFTIWLRLGRVEERSISNCRKKDAVRSAKNTQTQTQFCRPLTSQ